MSFLLALLTATILLAPQTARPPGVGLGCPADVANDEVCVFTDEAGIIAINPTANPVTVVIQIQRIENVELTYRYPFVEVLPPRSSRTLITYKIVKETNPFALDYEWGWALAR
jgi:hypothetical protein